MSRKNKKSLKDKKIPQKCETSQTQWFRSKFKKEHLEGIIIGLVVCLLWWIVQNVYEKEFMPLTLSPAEVIIGGKSGDMSFLTVSNRSNKSLYFVELDLSLENTPITSDDILTETKTVSNLNFDEPNTGSVIVKGNLFRDGKKHAYPLIEEIGPGEYAKVMIRFKDKIISKKHNAFIIKSKINDFSKKPPDTFYGPFHKAN